MKDAETLGKNARLIRTYPLFTMSIEEKSKAIMCLILYFIRKLKNIQKNERLKFINEDDITELEKSLVGFFMNHTAKYSFGLFSHQFLYKHQFIKNYNDSILLVI